jgi:excisionase family DNA binding protein
MDRLLTADELAERLGMKTEWVWAQARAGQIPHIRLGRYRRFRESAVEAWLHDLETGGTTSRSAPRPSQLRRSASPTFRRSRSEGRLESRSDAASQQRSRVSRAKPLTTHERERCGRLVPCKSPQGISVKTPYFRELVISRDFIRVSEGTRTPDRLDHNRTPGVFPTRSPPYLLGILALSCPQFCSN